MHKVSIFLFFVLGVSFGVLAQDTTAIEVSDSSVNTQWKNKLTSEKANTHNDSIKRNVFYRPTSDPQLVIRQDKRIELLSERYLKEKKTRGYKIQIYSSHSRWEAEKAKSTFMAEYADLPTPELLYQTPNFKIRFGNYRDRFEAEKYMKKIKENYPSPFLVKDEISVKLK